MDAISLPDPSQNATTRFGFRKIEDASDAVLHLIRQTSIAAGNEICQACEEKHSPNQNVCEQHGSKNRAI